MIVLVQTSVLAVGIEHQSKALKQLPLRLIKMSSGFEAARSLKNEKVDCVISSWDLPDMKNGLFLRNLRMTRPDIPAVAVIESENISQEIAARSLGLSAVITGQTTDRYLQQIVCQVLELASAVIEPIKGLEDRTRLQTSSRITKVSLSSKELGLKDRQWLSPAKSKRGR